MISGSAKPKRSAASTSGEVLVRMRLTVTWPGNSSFRTWTVVSRLTSAQRTTRANAGLTRMGRKLGATRSR